MRKVVLLLLVALLWGCQEGVVGPKEDTTVEYGKTAVSVPGLAKLGKKTANANYWFDLIISGKNMDDMKVSFRLSEKDTMFVVEKIPAGESRLFTGIIRTGKDITHEGSAQADIYAGKTANVQLYLQARGSAEVEIIIDNGDFPSPLTGCKSADGVLRGDTLESLTVEFLESSGDQFWTYLKRNGEFAGKFWGTLDGNKFFGEFHLESNGPGYRVVGSFSDDWSEYYADAYDMNDTAGENLGYIFGRTIDCGVEPPPVPDLSGCFDVKGEINVISLNDLQMRGAGIYNGVLQSYLYQGENIVAKFWGTLIGSYLDGGIYLLNDGYEAMVKGSFTSDWTAFKAALYDRNDTTVQVGSMGLYQTECTPAPQPPSSECFGVDGVILDDTLFGEVKMHMTRFDDYSFESELYRNGTLVGDFKGSFDNGDREFTGFFTMNNIASMVKGKFATDGSMFKGEVFDNEDTVIMIGYIDGHTIDCNDVQPPPQPDLLGCYDLTGEYGDHDLSDLMLYIKTSGNDCFQGSLADNGVYAGSIYCTVSGDNVSGYLYVGVDTVLVSGSLYANEGPYIKTELFDINDSTYAVGTMGAMKTVCPEN